MKNNYYKKFKLNMHVYDRNNKYTDIQIIDMFTEWAESKGLDCYGSICEINKK